jgi:hypothetical protein
MTPRDRELLGRIIECIDAVDGYTARVGAHWADDDMAVDVAADVVANYLPALRAEIGRALGAEGRAGLDFRA